MVKGAFFHAQSAVAEISILASLGQFLVPVHRRARVAIVSTGDELVELGEVCEIGQIVNSNALSLAAAVQECGAEPVLLGIARDERELAARGGTMNAAIRSNSRVRSRFGRLVTLQESGSCRKSGTARKC